MEFEPVFDTCTDVRDVDVDCKEGGPVVRCDVSAAVSVDFMCVGSKYYGVRDVRCRGDSCDVEVSVPAWRVCDAVNDESFYTGAECEVLGRERVRISFDGSASVEAVLDAMGFSAYFSDEYCPVVVGATERSFAGAFGVDLKSVEFDWEDSDIDYGYSFVRGTMEFSLKGTR